MKVIFQTFKFIIVISGLLLLACQNAASSNIVGDINGDKKISLVEAVNALQIVSGVKDSQTITKDLIIIFAPNPAIPVFDNNYWVWEYSFIIYNPNDFPMEILAFGNYNECSSDITECSFDSNEFANIFKDCGDGTIAITAKGTSCVSTWIIRKSIPPDSDIIGTHSIWFKNHNNEIIVTTSGRIILKKP